jgi:hypothetical protein
MAHTQKATPHVDNHRAYLHGVAKYLIDRIYGPNGPPWGTQFDELEDLVVRLGQVLQKSLMDQSLGRQASGLAHLEPQASQCPGCGRVTQDRDPEPRLVHSRAGEAEWLEPHRHCDPCRRAFFPSVAQPGD